MYKSLRILKFMTYLITLIAYLIYCNVIVKDVSKSFVILLLYTLFRHKHCLRERERENGRSMIKKNKMKTIESSQEIGLFITTTFNWSSLCFAFCYLYFDKSLLSLIVVVFSFLRIN